MAENKPENGDAYASTAEVAEALGVGVSTVKRWVDQGILPAHKTPGGHRKLLLADVHRLVRTGDFPRVDLSRLGVAAAAHDIADSKRLYRNVFEALRRGEPERLRDLFQAAHNSGVTVESLADEVIGPAMNRIGHDWEEGRLDIWHEHRGTQLCIAALQEVYGIFDAPANGHRPLAVGGGPEGDPYMLANRLAELALAAHGWNAVNLGPNTPMSSFQKAVEQLRPRLLWLSASHLANPEVFLEQYRIMYQAVSRLGVAVAIGGQALSDEIRSKMPYTTFGDGLTHLINFARTLNPEPQRPRRGRPRRA